MESKPTRSNPRKPLDGMEDKKIAKAKRAYKKFHGGKEPTDMKRRLLMSEMSGMLSAHVGPLDTCHQRKPAMTTRNTFITLTKTARMATSQ